jgi:putative transposase
MKYSLDRSAHSVYSLHYHLVIVVKYRRKVLASEAIRERLKEIVASLAPKAGIEILAQEPGEDHHHILFKATPKANLSNIVNIIKGTTARYLRKEFPETKKLLWGDSFWSDSYFVASTGQVSLDVLMEYVKSQGEKIADANE